MCRPTNRSVVRYLYPKAELRGAKGHWFIDENPSNYVVSKILGRGNRINLAWKDAIDRIQR